MYIVVISLLIFSHAALSMDNYDLGEQDKRRVPSFDTLGGIGLGKRTPHISLDSLADLGLEKRGLSSFDTLGGIGLGKRWSAPTVERRALSSFDTLGGIGLGKRDISYPYEKKSLSSFDTLAGIGLGKRARPFSQQFFIPFRTLAELKKWNEKQSE